MASTRARHIGKGGRVANAIYAACNAPASGVTLVFTRAGYTFRVRTGPRGRFSLALKPGVYSVRIAPAPAIGSGLAPRVVRVPMRGWAWVRLTVDTGIR